MVVNPRRGDVVWVWGLGDKKRGGSSHCPLKQQHAKPYKTPSWTAPKPTSELPSIMSNTSSSSSSNSNNHHRRRKERARRCPATTEDDVELGLSIGGAPPSDTTLFVKVYMEGQPIGRKLNMMAHTGYDHLIATLDHMFNANIILFLDDDDQHHYSHHNHVLTYQDDEGDWLMIGDVPWDLFLSSVKRLNISRAYPS